MEGIAAQSGSEQLMTAMYDYSVLIQDFVTTLETLADAVKKGDVEAAGRSGAALTEYYLSMEEAQKTFNTSLGAVVDQITEE